MYLSKIGLGTRCQKDWRAVLWTDLTHLGNVNKLKLIDSMGMSVMHPLIWLCNSFSFLVTLTYFSIIDWGKMENKFYCRKWMWVCILFVFIDCMFVVSNIAHTCAIFNRKSCILLVLLCQGAVARCCMYAAKYFDFGEFFLIIYHAFYDHNFTLTSKQFGYFLFQGTLL